MPTVCKALTKHFTLFRLTFHNKVTWVLFTLNLQFKRRRGHRWQIICLRWQELLPAILWAVSKPVWSESSCSESVFYAAVLVFWYSLRVMKRNVFPTELFDRTDFKSRYISESKGQKFIQIPVSALPFLFPDSRPRTERLYWGLKTSSWEMNPDGPDSRKELAWWQHF